MPKKTPPLNHVAITAAALRLAAVKGWPNVTLAAVAKSAGIPLAALTKEYASTAGLLPVIAAEIDREAWAGKIFSGAPHDVLFDALMARFDILHKHRPAILSIGEAAKNSAAMARILACATVEGIYRLIEAIRFDTPPRPVLAAGLSAVYGWAFLAWRRDASRDMAKTMAALDRALRLSGKIIAFLTPRS